VALVLVLYHHKESFVIYKSDCDQTCAILCVCTSPVEAGLALVPDQSFAIIRVHGISLYCLVFFTKRNKCFEDMRMHYHDKSAIMTSKI
jgi:hypothetical protein